MTEKKDIGEVLAVNKTIRIFEILANNKKMTLTELSKNLDENKSTMYRFLCTLINHGYVMKDEQDNFSLTLKLYELGSCVYSRFDIVDYAVQDLKCLAQLSGETVHLAIDNHGQIVYLYKIESMHSLKVTMRSKVGNSAPEYCTGIGKILLAWSDKNKLESYLDSCKFTPFTKNTINNRYDLEKELKKIKLQQYSIDNEEHEEGVICVAAPIFGIYGNIMASISISGPSIRMTNSRIEALIPSLLKHSKEISKKIGNI